MPCQYRTIVVSPDTQGIHVSYYIPHIPRICQCATQVTPTLRLQYGEYSHWQAPKAGPGLHSNLLRLGFCLPDKNSALGYNMRLHI